MSVQKMHLVVYEAGDVITINLNGTRLRLKRQEDGSYMPHSSGVLRQLQTEFGETNASAVLKVLGLTPAPPAQIPTTEELTKARTEKKKAAS